MEQQDKKTILVIDDEKDESTYLSALLEDQGYGIMTAGDGNEALEMVKRTLPDLITLDITMPEKSGIKFYREMRENEDWRKVPIIIVTGVAPELERFISTRKQVPPPEGYMSKPIDQDRFLQLVGKLLS